MIRFEHTISQNEHFLKSTIAEFCSLQINFTIASIF